MVALIGTHRLPEFWTNPDEFDPDRFAPHRREDHAHPSCGHRSAVGCTSASGSTSADCRPKPFSTNYFAPIDGPFRRVMRRRWSTARVSIRPTGFRSTSNGSGASDMHVITQNCCNDAACVAACPVGCIHPMPDEPGYDTAEMLYIDPEVCIDCGACVAMCPVDAIRTADDLGEAIRPIRGHQRVLRRERRTASDLRLNRFPSTGPS